MLLVVVAGVVVLGCISIHQKYVSFLAPHFVGVGVGVRVAMSVGVSGHVALVRLLLLCTRHLLIWIPNFSLPNPVAL